MTWDLSHQRRIERTLQDGLQNRDRAPLLWVGAGLSIASGYPSWNSLAEKLRFCSRATLPSELSGTPLIEEFVRQNGRGDLADALASILLSKSHAPLPYHLDLVRLPWYAIVTTNYDALLEHACIQAAVSHIVHALDRSLYVTPPPGTLPIWKPHGSVDDLVSIVLDSTSYAEYPERYPAAVAVMNDLLRRRSVVFFGYSMTDPRFIEWLEALSVDERRGLKSSVVVMIRGDWRGLAPSTKQLLVSANVFPCLLDDYKDIPDLIAAIGSSLQEPRKSPETPSLGATANRDRSYLWKFCDRTAPARLFSASLNVDINPIGPPRLYFIRGQEHDRPRSLADRLWSRELRIHAKQTWQLDTGLLPLKTIELHDIMDAPTRFRILKQDLFEAFDPELDRWSGALTPTSFLDRFRGKPYRLAGISLSINLDMWDNVARTVLIDWLGFWAAVGDHSVHPSADPAVRIRIRFVIFINCVSFGTLINAGHLRSYIFIRHFCRKHATQPSSIGRLTLIRRRDVRAWLAAYGDSEPIEKRLEVMRRIFGLYPFRSMEVVESKLQRFFQGNA